MCVCLYVCIYVTVYLYVRMCVLWNFHDTCTRFIVLLATIVLLLLLLKCREVNLKVQQINNIFWMSSKRHNIDGAVTV